MSPRKKKQRNCVCPLRDKLGLVFKPAGTPLRDLEVVVLEHDELEALYLCDGLDLNQELAGEKMGVSRGTVQRLLSHGRKKVVDSLVGQKALTVAGEVSHNGVVPLNAGDSGDAHQALPPDYITGEQDAVSMRS